MFSSVRHFHTSTRRFAQIISGKDAAADISKQLQAEVASFGPSFKPGLTILQVGGRADSNVYINMKIKAAEKIGIKANHLKLERTVTQSQILQELDKLNADPNVHGIIVQMPLDCDDPTIDSHLVTNSVDPGKDVDGLTTINEGKIATGDLTTGFQPCTPAGCMDLIKRSGVQVEGANAVVLGRSKIVGTPMSEMLKWANATVTICHSKTKNLEEVVRNADIVVVGIGRANMVKGSWIKPGAVVIDCGINSIDDSSKKSGYKLVGDVEYDDAAKVAGHITPVPGGVGPMTVALLMKNTVLAASRAWKKSQ